MLRATASATRRLFADPLRHLQHPLQLQPLQHEPQEEHELQESQGFVQPLQSGLEHLLQEPEQLLQNELQAVKQSLHGQGPEPPEGAGSEPGSGGAASVRLRSVGSAPPPWVTGGPPSEERAPPSGGGAGGRVGSHRSGGAVLDGAAVPGPRGGDEGRLGPRASAGNEESHTHTKTKTVAAAESARRAQCSPRRTAALRACSSRA